jgi:parallel beta-helix repeat protein
MVCVLVCLARRILHKLLRGKVIDRKSQKEYTATVDVFISEILNRRATFMKTSIANIKLQIERRRTIGRWLPCAISQRGVILKFALCILKFEIRSFASNCHVSIGIRKGKTTERKGVRMKHVGLFMVVCVIATTSVATAKVWHVPDECPTIQAGIDSAAAGDTVLVADGTYTGDGNRDIDFTGKPILVTSENGPEVTVIDCEGSSSEPHRGFHFHSEEDSSSGVKGFTITNGYAFGDWPQDWGGAILCDSSSSPTIIGNTITGNTAFLCGGICCCYSSSPIIEKNTIIGNDAFQYAGIACWVSSSPTIVGNIIAENTAYASGGGIGCWDSSNSTIEGNTITGNTSEEYAGGGISIDESSPIIKGNTIAENTVGEYYGGGGICCRGSSSAIIKGNTIINNMTTEYGGGILCWFSASPTIERNIIVKNYGRDGGGGICCYHSSSNIRYNTITSNTANWIGGGIFCYEYSSPTIDGNTIIANTAHSGGGIGCYESSSSAVLNSILWADSAGAGQEIYVDETSSIEVTYSDVEGGWEGEGNIDADPLFVLPEHRDYRLLWGSPCIDSGHPDSLDPDGTRSDMGAYYFDQSHPVTIYLTPDTTLIVRPGELGVTYTLINIEPDPWTFWLRSDVMLPNGKPYPGNPIVGPKKVTLPGNKNVQRHMMHPIPGAAPLGNYTYKSRIGLPPDQLIDQDSFEFEVVE